MRITLALLLVAGCSSEGRRNPNGNPNGTDDGGGSATVDMARAIDPNADLAMAVCTPNMPDKTGCTCGAGDTNACYSGPAQTRGVGNCRDGMQTCTGGEFGTFGPCTGQVLPSSEGNRCSDLIDNDCNGLTDCMDPACANDPACLNVNPSCKNGSSPDSSGRCPMGTYAGFDPNTFAQCCVPCTVNDCSSHGECCVAAACAADPSCQGCVMGKPMLDPACQGRVDQDCDDYPEDCDQLCCPCRPASQCTDSSGKLCGQGMVPCDDGTSTLVCINVTADPNHCGACDYVCSAGQKCISAKCQ
jgi:hypothetical protein